MRAALRMGANITAINDPFMDPNYMVYMLRYDSTHRTLTNEISSDGASLFVDGKKIAVYVEKEPAKIPWEGCDIVLECTGAFTTIEKAQAHIHGSVKKVIISAPSADANMFVMGVNN
jgi:glyceraldehyde 3-phosphate dehydrogenase